MRKDVFRKGMVLGIIILFVGASVVPSIIGKIDSYKDINKIGNINSDCDIKIFYPTDDCYIKHNKPDNPSGGHPYMGIRNEFGKDGSSGWAWNGLIKFDISSILPDSYIVSATLNLYYYHYTDTDPEGRPLNLYRATSNWDEDNVTWDAQPSYAPQPTTSASVPSYFGWMPWDVTSDVQDFVDGTVINYGWSITDETYWGKSGIPTTDFRTKENGSDIPYLEVVIDNTPPECNIEKPRERYRYLNNKQIGERSIFRWTRVIGPRVGIMVEVKARDEQSGIDRVEFYINDIYYGENTEPNPNTLYYEYGWVETRFGKCTLEAIAVDKAGHRTSCGIIRDVLYFNIE